eukprot:1599663-Amphidinium_carterae.1
MWGFLCVKIVLFLLLKSREVVLECVYSRDVDVTSLPLNQRAIAFSADDGGGRSNLQPKPACA